MHAPCNEINNKERKTDIQHCHPIAPADFHDLIFIGK
jgi:hypothetical protein